MASLTNVSTPEQIQALLMKPAGEVPPGMNTDDANPQNLDVSVAIVLALWITIPALATLMRIYTKIFLIKALAYEDCESVKRSCFRRRKITVLRCHRSWMGNLMATDGRSLC